MEEIKKEHLPPELRNLTLKEQREYLDNLDKERQDLNAKARELDKKRTEFIAKKQTEDEKKRPADAFDTQVLQLLQSQARRAQIEYALPAAPSKK